MSGSLSGSLSRSLTTLSVLLLLVMSLIIGSGLASADVLLPGTKKVRRDTTIDFGAYTDLAPWSYTVQSGDTLSGLAEKHLGSAKRHEQIVELNNAMAREGEPRLTAATLKAGQTIVMPPRSADSSKWVHFFGALWDAQVERAYHGQSLPHHHYWTSLWAVPHAHFAEFCSKVNVDRREARGAIQALRDVEWIAKAEPKLCGYVTLSDGSAVESIDETYRVESIERGVIQLTDQKEQPVDEAGEPVSKKASALTPLNGVLVLLAAAGIGGLLLRSRRSSGGSVDHASGS